METHNHTTTMYTCPMHPEIMRDKPGNCPKCRMHIVPVISKEGKSSVHQEGDKSSEKMDHSHHVQRRKATVELVQADISFKKYTFPDMEFKPLNTPEKGLRESKSQRMDSFLSLYFLNKFPKLRLFQYIK